MWFEQGPHCWCTALNAIRGLACATGHRIPGQANCIIIDAEFIAKATVLLSTNIIGTECIAKERHAHAHTIGIEFSVQRCGFSTRADTECLSKVGC